MSKIMDRLAAKARKKADARDPAKVAEALLRHIRNMSAAGLAAHVGIGSDMTLKAKTERAAVDLLRDRGLIEWDHAACGWRLAKASE